MGDVKNLVLIQARVGSSRLPGKVLKDICGKTDLQRVIERVRRSKKSDEAMVVTSIEKENLPIVRLCAELGVRLFAGSQEDVLDRYYQAAKLIRPDHVIRVTADCPMFDWRYLDQAIDAMKKDTDYLWMGEDAFPDGLDFEIIGFHALKKAWAEARLASEREHVTLYIKKHPERFRLQIFDFPIKGIGHYRWTLDEPRDYEFIQAVYSHFMDMGKEFFVTEDIVGYLGERPEIVSINSEIKRNEGLEKSMKHDRILAERQESEAMWDGCDKHQKGSGNIQ